MRDEPIRLDSRHAADVFAQLRETATYRGWALLAVAVTPTHVHLVVRVEGDPEGADVLRDFKSYAARRLNRRWGRPPNGSWWSESGSRRVLREDGNVTGAVDYVAGQGGAWLVWYTPVVRAQGDESERHPPGERPA
ncbi:transposase [bacterium]|nr:transposase [bacterium]